MNEINFQANWARVMSRLSELDKNLTYHNIHHTEDVYRQCMRIAAAEGITDERQLFWLRYAALYHDVGFVQTYLNHEKKGCEIFIEYTRDLNLPSEDIDAVTAIIMATRVPQQPSTLLERIICDADLDYLGREDFFEVADNLRKEFIHFKMVPDEDAWRSLQVAFLSNHHYHTKSNAVLRDPQKYKHLEAISHSADFSSSQQ